MGLYICGFVIIDTLVVRLFLVFSFLLFMYIYLLHESSPKFIFVNSMVRIRKILKFLENLFLFNVKKEIEKEKGSKK